MASEVLAVSSNVLRFVLTGGPCGGKTTALARIATFLRQRGFRVFTIPEAATLMFTHGATFADLETEEALLNFQLNLLKTQMHLEDTFASIAACCGQKSVLLCDRGSMDGSAYIPAHIFDQVLQQQGVDLVALRDQRYDAVLHMVTAANGAAEFYNFENGVRSESPEEAIRLDARVRDGWVGHPNMFMFNNDSDFETKLRRVVNTVAKEVGLPSSQKVFRKYLLAMSPNLQDIPVHYQTFEVEKVYLRMASVADAPAQPPGTTPPPPTPEEAQRAPPPRRRSSSRSGRRPSGLKMDYTFVRRSTQPGGSSFGQTTVRYENGQKIEVKRVITAREYQQAVQQRRDPARLVVRQTRLCYLWEGSYCEVNTYQSPHPELCLMSCQAASPAHTTEEDADTTEGAGQEAEDGEGDAPSSNGGVAMPPGMEQMPPFVQVVADVTGENTYSAFHLSLNDYSLAKEIARNYVKYLC